ncbi:MAG TPA: glucosaminidase domain-containing protein [Cyclobacteriaceae bacterium]|nr:glucosaminidase domain-containing protein [Cyclobacteriaceae bacterium]
MVEQQTDYSFKDVTPTRIALLILGAIILVLVIHWLADEDYKVYRVKSMKVKVASLSQVELLQDSLVKPFLYSNVAGLELLDPVRIKHTFISVVLPAVLVAKHNMKEDSLRLARLTKKKHWSKSDSALYLELKNQFRAKDLDNLLARMGSLPNSIVLAQAAVETGWGQSRFFLEGNNVFGIWSYNANEPRIQTSRDRENTSVFVRSYENISESISDYFKTLASARAYYALRKARLETNDPFKLLPHLKYYSERRTAYTDQLKSVILKNDLTRYDRYIIDPHYLVSE